MYLYIRIYTNPFSQIQLYVHISKHTHMLARTNSVAHAHPYTTLQTYVNVFVCVRVRDVLLT